jgi:hypothetical protein
MAKQLHPSDFALDRPEKAPHKVVNQLFDTGQMASAPLINDEQRVKASWYLSHTGNAELWEALGLDEYVNGRRRRLGVLVPGEPLPGGVACPSVNCLAPPDGPCVTAGGVPIRRRHVARVRLAERLKAQRKAAEKLLDSIGTPAVDR